MLTREIILKFLQNNYDDLKFNYHILKIGLVGSFARNEQHEQSDIDLLVEFEPGTQDIMDLKIQLKKYIKTNLNRDVDICREKYLKPYIKESIKKEVIYI